MRCPDEIAQVLLRILSTALLRIRHLGGQGCAGECEIESDHVHNLPALIQDYSPARLEYYWSIERVHYLKLSEGMSLGEFVPLWEELSVLMTERGISTGVDT